MRITTPIYDVPLWTRIDGAIAIVTGGARGFGRAVVLSLVDAGASIAIADLDVAASDEIVAQVADKMAPCSGRQRSLAFAPLNRHLLEAFDVIVSGPDFGSAPPAIDILLVPNLVTMILGTPPYWAYRLILCRLEYSALRIAWSIWRMRRS